MSCFNRPFASSILLVAGFLGLPASSAHAQANGEDDGRARMELSLDHGVGVVSEQGDDLNVALAADLRLYDPSGFGGVLRAGVLNLYSVTVDLGAAYRFALDAGGGLRVELAVAAGGSVAYATVPRHFSLDSFAAMGGWAMAHVDLRYERFFVGVGVAGHVLEPLESEPDYGTSRETILSLTPLLRIGGEWSL